MKVIIRESAADDLDQIFSWIAMGRPGLIEGTRELVEYPYIIVYKVFDDRGEIVVLSIVHGAQDRKLSGE